MRYDSEHKERTRRGILGETANAIREKGPERIGVAEVMSKLGLTHGGFYAHFASKDDLVAETIQYMFDKSYEWFLSNTDGVAPEEGLRAFVRAYLSRAHRDARDRGCAIAVLAGDSDRLPEAARARFVEGAARLPQGMAKLLIARGAADAERVADSAVAEMVGTLLLARSFGKTERSDRILRNARETVKARLGVA